MISFRLVPPPLALAACLYNVLRMGLLAFLQPVPERGVLFSYPGGFGDDEDDAPDFSDLAS